jgi:uncharacterized membrane protein (DUF373 family)
MKGSLTPETRPAPATFIRRAVGSLVWAEHVVFFSIGVLLFGAALALLKGSVIVLLHMFVGGDQPAAAYASAFLDVTLLVLMVVELAYTVILSLRGSVLQAEPFLIVGLIAVIRRMLVITVGEAGPTGSRVSQNAAELGILTGVVIVFVGSIALLRRQPKRDERLDVTSG